MREDVSPCNRRDAESDDEAEHLQPGLNEAGTFDVDEVTGKEEDGTEVASSSEKIDQTSNGDIRYAEKPDINNGVFGYLEFVENKDRYEETSNDEESNDRCRLENAVYVSTKWL